MDSGVRPDVPPVPPFRPIATGFGPDRGPRSARQGRTAGHRCRRWGAGVAAPARPWWPAPSACRSGRHVAERARTSSREHTALRRSGRTYSRGVGQPGRARGRPRLLHRDGDGRHDHPFLAGAPARGRTSFSSTSTPSRSAATTRHSWRSTATPGPRWSGCWSWRIRPVVTRHGPRSPQATSTSGVSSIAPCSGRTRCRCGPSVSAPS